jgi:hypothetical protein
MEQSTAPLTARRLASQPAFVPASQPQPNSEASALRGVCCVASNSARSRSGSSPPSQASLRRSSFHPWRRVGGKRPTTARRAGAFHRTAGSDGAATATPAASSRPARTSRDAASLVTAEHDASPRAGRSDDQAPHLPTGCAGADTRCDKHPRATGRSPSGRPVAFHPAPTRAKRLGTGSKAMSRQTAQPAPRPTRRSSRRRSRSRS